MVKTSVSVASAQMARLESRQNFLVQSVQVCRREEGLVVLSLLLGRLAMVLLRGMMVELVKQVHLQKEVGALEGWC